MLEIAVCGLCNTGVDISTLRIFNGIDEYCPTCFRVARFGDVDSVSGDYLMDTLEQVTATEWHTLATGGGCHVIECLLPYALPNGVDRVWVSGDDTLDSWASVSSFGSRVWVGLMAYGLEAEDKDDYCIAECTRETGAVWNDDGEIENVTIDKLCDLILECLDELGLDISSL